ncbi:hypothetical protein U1Q18_009391 [Sarracenia purpurea var. burkii]
MESNGICLVPWSMPRGIGCSPQRVEKTHSTYTVAVDPPPYEGGVFATDCDEVAVDYVPHSVYSTEMTSPTTSGRMLMDFHFRRERVGANCPAKECPNTKTTNPMGLRDPSPSTDLMAANIKISMDYDASNAGTGKW